MRTLRSRQIILGQIILVLVAFALGAGSLLVPGSALADRALFRFEQRWHNFPNPPVTPHGAGQYQAFIYPYDADFVGKPGVYRDPPATATVEPGNPRGGKFTLPQSFRTSMYTGTLLARTAWPGYTTVYNYSAYNGPGKFGPSFNAPLKNGRLYFPTTGKNPAPTYTYYGYPYYRNMWLYGNYGLGNPVTETTTFGGEFDQSRGGSIMVEPGENRFGGTFRLFAGPDAGWDQYIFKFTPRLYGGYGYYVCLDDGMYGCTPDTFVSEPGTTAVYLGVWWLLTGTYNDPDKRCGPGEGGKLHGCYKATYPVGEGNYPTPGGNASYKRRSQHYLNLIHPWTTGKATVVQPIANQGTGVITPMASGYDKTYPAPGVTITVQHYDWNLNYNPGLETYTTTTTSAYATVLKGVTRVVSMVRPRLTWTFAVPLTEEEPIENIWSPVRMWRLKVFFLPEPGGMLMLGVGIAGLAGLSLLRKR